MVILKRFSLHDVKRHVNLLRLALSIGNVSHTVPQKHTICMFSDTPDLHVNFAFQKVCIVSKVCLYL